MTRASRIILARLAIQCARWFVILDASYASRIRKAHDKSSLYGSEYSDGYPDFDEYSRNDIYPEYDGIADVEFALQLMYSEANSLSKETSSGFAYTRFKKSLLDLDSNLKRNQSDIESQQEDRRLNYFLQKFGITSLDNKNYEIHHIEGAKTHYIEGGHDKTYYDNILTGLKNNEESLLNELDHIVMLPGWFHRYCTSKHIEFNNRKNYYQELKNILIRLKESFEKEAEFEKIQEQRRNEGKKPLKERRKLLCDIKCLGFNEKSIDNAIRSIKNLASVTGNENDKYIIDCLKECYIYLRKQLIEKIKNINI